MNKTRIATTVAVPVVMAAAAWIGGYDFDTRGFMPAYTFLLGIGACLAVWFWPGWE